MALIVCPELAKAVESLQELVQTFRRREGQVDSKEFSGRLE